MSKARRVRREMVKRWSTVRFVHRGLWVKVVRCGLAAEWYMPLVGGV